MGRIFALVFFFIAFVVFVIIKSAIFGVKSAYKAVFDQNDDERKIQIIAKLNADIHKYMLVRYDGNPKNLSGLIFLLTQMVQSEIIKSGYQVTWPISMEFVKESIISDGFATREEVCHAADCYKLV